MDVPRKGAARARWIRRITYGAVTAIALLVITLGLKRVKPAAPPVQRSQVVIDTVKRGPMVRQVRGLGTLVAEEILWVPALTDGRVERILVRPGALVRPDTVIMELGNEQLELEALNAEWQVKTAEATLADLRAKLRNQELDQEAAAAKVASDHATAKLNYEVERKLAEQGLTSDVKVQTTRAVADQLFQQSKIEQQKISSIRDSVVAQMAAQQVQIDKLKAEYAMKRRQVEQLRIRAGVNGVLQQLGADPAAPVEVGQRWPAGTILAKVSQPSRLKAELKVAETQAKDIVIGQLAEVDTRNGVIPGRVSRIDPASQNGTVTVDVRLEGPLPPGARPELSVDGVIELERLSNVLYIGRPVQGQPNSTISLFKLDQAGLEANQIPVTLGRASVTTVEVVQGLIEGDRVILSDLTEHSEHDRIRLN
jgi:HlyD family secretion protein